MEFKSYLQKRKSSPSTIQSHQDDVSGFEKWLENEGLDVTIVNQKDVLSYLQYCKEKGNVNSTINHKINSLRKYFNYLELKPNPCQQLQVKGITRRLPTDLLTEKELSHLYEIYPENTLHEKRDKLILGLLIYQGITTAELINLEVEDISLAIETLEIKASRKGQYRKLKLQTHQIESIKIYLESLRPKLEKESGLVTNQLIINSGKSERKDKLKNTINELVKRLKNRRNYFKNARQLRASRITLWLQEHNLREVQQMAGHRYISSTERYQMDKVEDLQKALDKYHPRK